MVTILPSPRNAMAAFAKNTSGRPREGEEYSCIGRVFRRRSNDLSGALHRPLSNIARLRPILIVTMVQDGATRSCDIEDAKRLLASRIPPPVAPPPGPIAETPALAATLLLAGI